MNENRSVNITLDQLREMLAEFNDLAQMADTLAVDVNRSDIEQEKQPTDQYLRRNFVLIFSSSVESFCNGLKKTVLKLWEPLGLQLSFDQLSKLQEVWLDDKGFPVVGPDAKPKLRFMRFEDNLRFSHEVFALLSASKAKLSFGVAGYKSFQQTIRVRDRLMHPKKLSDLVVTDEEMVSVHLGRHWYLTESIVFLGDCSKSMDHFLESQVKQ